MSEHFVSIGSGGGIIHIDIDTDDLDKTPFVDALKTLLGSFKDIRQDVEKCAEQNVHNAFAYKDFFFAIEEVESLVSDE